jgi:hypothetical protein
MSRGPIIVTAVGEAGGARAAAAAVACCLGIDRQVGVLVDIGDLRATRPALFATEAARKLEERLAAHLPERAVAARGRLCVMALDRRAPELEQLAGAVAVCRDVPTVISVPAARFRDLVDEAQLAPAAVLMRADLPRDRAQTALAAADLIRRGLRVCVLRQPLGWLPGRCASAGLPLPHSALPARLLSRLRGGEREAA